MNIEKNTDHLPFFSILVPVYNKETELEKCLDSILGQSFGDLEVIAVDDGSEDNSYEVLKGIAGKDKRVKILRNEKNKSLIASRITAMKEARGKYILNIDSDDFIERETCKKLHDDLSNSGCDILAFGYVEEPSGNTGYNPDPGDDILKSVMERQFPHNLCFKCCSGILIKRFLEKCDSFYCNMSEDMYFSTLLIDLASSFRKIDDVFYHYVKSDGMTSRRKITHRQLDNMVISVTNKSVYLKKYMESYNPKMLPFCNTDYENDINFIARLIRESEDSLYNRLENLEYLDERLGTEFGKKYAEKIEKDAERYNYVVDSSFGKTLMIFSAFIGKRVKEKIRKIMGFEK